MIPLPLLDEGGELFHFFVHRFGDGIVSAEEGELNIFIRDLVPLSSGLGGYFAQKNGNRDTEIIAEFLKNLGGGDLHAVRFPLGHKRFADSGLRGSPAYGDSSFLAEVCKSIIEHNITPSILCILIKFTKFNSANLTRIKW